MPKISKDSLVPKEVEKKTVCPEEKSTFNISFSTIDKRKLVSTVHRRSLSLSSQGNTVRLTEIKKSNLRKSLYKEPINDLRSLVQDN